MFRLSFLILNVLSNLLFTQTANAFEQAQSQSMVPLRIQNPGADIPKVGSSAFDKLFFNDKKQKYDIPFPIGRLVDEIVDRTQNSKEANHAFTGATHSYFPFSRSLQRPLDLSYDPLLSPRMVFSLTHVGNALADNKVFWAYVQARDQLEVISYNEEAGRYEFQIIKNYSRSPEVYYAPRAKCLTCHQNQAPILSVNSWEDSASSGNKMAMALLRAHSIPGEHMSQTIDALLIGSKKSSNFIGGLDHSVRTSDRLANFQRLFVHACRTRECRLELTLSLFFNSTYDCANFESFRLSCKSIDDLIRNSSLNNEDFATSQLSDGNGHFFEILKSLVPESEYLNEDFTDLATSRFAKSPKAKMELIESLKSLSRDDNPASSRLEKILTPNHFASFEADRLDLRDSFLKSLAPGREFEREFQTQVQNAIFQLYKNGSSLFDKRALNLVQLEKELLAILGLQRTYGSPYLRRQVQIQNHAKVFSENTLAIFSNQSLNKLAKNCGSCHQNSEGYPNPFLVGSEDQVESNVKQLKDKMLFRIQNKMMPPTEALQNKFLDSEDREVIIQYLRSL